MIFDRRSRVEADPAALRRQAWADFNAAKQIRSRTP